MSQTIIIDERIDQEGCHRQTFLKKINSDYVLVESGQQAELPGRAIIVTMQRYGRELNHDISLSSDGLPLGERGVLIPFRFHARVDAEARHYLAWCEKGQAPIGALSRDIAAALRYLSGIASDTKDKA
jgi:hypothetical protein